MNRNPDLKTLLAANSITCSDSQLAQLTRYRELVTQWNPRQNMVAPSTLPDFDTRHILDSAQIVSFLPEAGQQGVNDALYSKAELFSLLDIGSGAGLPGLVVAILCPWIKITLAEIIQKKASFLTTAAYELGLKNARVHSADVRTLAPETFNVVTARAVTNLADLLDLSDNLLAPDGRWLLLKGQAAEQEINGLEKPLRLTISSHRSIVLPEGVVLEISRAKEPV
jgi:16S rRNA (guanine527-N7)-methyltransferase